MVEVVRKLKCKACQHEWIPNTTELPKVCPKCKSKNWQTGRKRPPIAEQRAASLKKKIEEAERLLQKFVPSDIKAYNLAGVINAGSWKEVFGGESTMLSAQDIIGWKEGDYIFIIDGEHGDCLTGDGIYPGDRVHMRPDVAWHNGDIVFAAGVDAHSRHFATLKHIRYQNGKELVELYGSGDNPHTIVARAADVTVNSVLISVTHDVRRGGGRK